MKIYVSEEMNMRPTGGKLKGGGVKDREKCTLWKAEIIFKLVFGCK